MHLAQRRDESVLKNHQRLHQKFETIDQPIIQNRAERVYRFELRIWQVFVSQEFQEEESTRNNDITCRFSCYKSNCYYRPLSGS